MGIKTLHAPAAQAAGNISPLPALSARLSEAVRVACDLSAGGVARIALPDATEAIEIGIVSDPDDEAAGTYLRVAADDGSREDVPEDDEDLADWMAANVRKIHFGKGGIANRILRVQGADELLLSTDGGLDVELVALLGT